jgi:D-alanyl-D-alanine carboxypeptidase
MAEPEIGAKAAILVEYPSGRILFQRAMHERLAPASTTKILTTILALEEGRLDQLVTVDPADLVGESSMGLVAGEQQTLLDLIYGMMLPSGNDAAMSVARALGSQAVAASASPTDPLLAFTDMMNARVAQLGLENSHFVNPHGLDAEDHYSSAYDMASLTWYAMHFDTFNEVSRQVFYEAPGHPLKNTNEMLTRYEGADGAKTGWTDWGGLCLVTTATRGEHRLISVVLNAPHWYADSTALLDYGFARLGVAPSERESETLSVASRGTALWLLATPSPLPSPSAEAAMAQGGGLPALSSVSAAGGAPLPEEGDQRFTMSGPVLSAERSASFDPLAGLLGVLFAVAFVVGLASLARHRVYPSRLPTLAMRVGGAATSKVAAGSAAPYAPPVQAPRGEGVRTLGTPPIARRREPNLLLSPEDRAIAHVERATALAAEGRQGSSMAEFLLAIRAGGDLRVEEIDEAFGLQPAGFLALSRAQIAAHLPDDAQATLEYAIAASPGDRILRLALQQFQRR